MTPQTLMKLANTGKCIIWLSGRHMPATFLTGMPFRVVLNVLPRIKIYKPRGKKVINV